MKHTSGPPKQINNSDIKTKVFQSIASDHRDQTGARFPLLYSDIFTLYVILQMLPKVDLI
jgi:hypothetical protein